MSNKNLYQGITIVTDPRVKYKVVYYSHNGKALFDSDVEREANSDGELIYYSEWLDNPVSQEAMTKQVNAITKEVRKMGIHAWLRSKKQGEDSSEDASDETSSLEDNLYF